MSKKLCVVTGSRAEYGLLYWLMREISDSRTLELQVSVTGAHLSPEYGLTYQLIEEDGFFIDRKVEMLVAGCSGSAIAKSVGLGVIGFSEAFSELAPDLLVVLGDRFEVLSAVAAALFIGIPVAHIHGGELSLGAYDDAIRHSITKMSHLHFAATETYRRRIIQMGEDPERVFHVGGLGIDNIKRLSLLERSAFEDSIDFKLGRKNLLVTFHPPTLAAENAEGQLRALLNALHTLEDTHLIFTYPNADKGASRLIDIVADYVASNPHRACMFQTLGQVRYLSALKHVDGVVGNSSSGLIEAPAFRIGTVNIGDRQDGRIKATSVIDCEPNERAITKALQRLFSEEFRAGLHETQNPYGDGGASQRICRILERIPLESVSRKMFYDLKPS